MNYRKSILVISSTSFLLAACGNTATAISAPSTSVVASSTNSTATSTPAAGARAALPAATGTIAAVSGTTLEVQNPTSGQTTVTFSASTVLTKTISTTASALVAGICVTAVGTPSTASSSTTLFGRPVTATTVTISQPVNGSCNLGAAAGGFGGRRFPGGSGGTTAGGGASGTARFPGIAKFATASGLVTSFANGVAQVSATDRATGATVSIPVTVGASTSYLERTSATAADLVVGECARAVGTMNSIGAIAATRIAISSPNANGCAVTGRFGFGAPQGGTLG